MVEFKGLGAIDADRAVLEESLNRGSRSWKDDILLGVNNDLAVLSRRRGVLDFRPVSWL